MGLLSEYCGRVRAYFAGEKCAVQLCSQFLVKIEFLHTSLAYPRGKKRWFIRGILKWAEQNGEFAPGQWFQNKPAIAVLHHSLLLSGPACFDLRPVYKKRGLP